MTEALLAVVELGGYPNFSVLYQAAGFEVIMAHGIRKALVAVKRYAPAVIVAEFNFQSDFRDRTSTLESLMATVQTRCPSARVIVFYEQDHAAHLDKLLARFRVFATLAFPVDQAALRQVLERARTEPHPAGTG